MQRSRLNGGNMTRTLIACVLVLAAATLASRVSTATDSNFRRLQAQIEESRPLITSHGVDVGGSTLHYLEAGTPAATTVLLLHGARFTSETWRDLKTIEVVSDAGHHVVALDLPGYGSSPTSRTPRDEYLQQALEQLWPDGRFVIVSPSMSGGFSLPFVARHPERVAGFVPVAPVGIDAHRGALERVEVATLVMWGQDDRVIPVSQADVLAETLDGETLIFAGAGHPCYLDQPDEFHRALLAFIAGL